MILNRFMLILGLLVLSSSILAEDNCQLECNKPMVGDQIDCLKHSITLTQNCKERYQLERFEEEKKIKSEFNGRKQNYEKQISDLLKEKASRNMDAHLLSQKETYAQLASVNQVVYRYKLRILRRILTSFNELAQDFLTNYKSKEKHISTKIGDLVNSISIDESNICATKQQLEDILNLEKELQDSYIKKSTFSIQEIDFFNDYYRSEASGHTSLVDAEPGIMKVFTTSNILLDRLKYIQSYSANRYKKVSKIINDAIDAIESKIKKRNEEIRSDLYEAIIKNLLSQLSGQEPSTKGLPHLELKFQVLKNLQSFQLECQQPEPFMNKGCVVLLSNSDQLEIELNNLLQELPAVIHALSPENQLEFSDEIGEINLNITLAQWDRAFALYASLREKIREELP
ncbi:MAG: hypothetical protein HQK52_10250 [Oligoflexia bacterium]|nr:hypothetical protein [Oligoflexia bacterium]